MLGLDEHVTHSLKKKAVQRNSQDAKTAVILDLCVLFSVSSETAGKIVEYKVIY